jgi:hypothetical protein
MSEVNTNNTASALPAESIHADFLAVFEFVGSEELKFEGNKIMHKHECYLHDPTKKYPTPSPVYLQEKMEAGYYALGVDAYIQKDKLQFRKSFKPVAADKIVIGRTGLATRK